MQFMYKYGSTNRRLLFSAHVHVSVPKCSVAVTATHTQATMMMMRHNMNSERPRIEEEKTSGCCSFQSGRLLLMVVVVDGVNMICESIQRKIVYKKREKRTIRYVLIATVPISHVWTTWMHELANQHTKIRKIVFVHSIHRFWIIVNWFASSRFNIEFPVKRINV